MGKRSEKFTSEELRGFCYCVQSGIHQILLTLETVQKQRKLKLKVRQSRFVKIVTLYRRTTYPALPNGLHLTYRDIHARPGEMGRVLVSGSKNKQTEETRLGAHVWCKVDEKHYTGSVSYHYGRYYDSYSRDFAKRRNWSRDDAHIYPDRARQK